MTKGKLYYHNNFTYKDGAEGGHKLLLLLNTPKHYDPYLILKTTSKPQRGIVAEGCYSQFGFYVTSERPFIKTTWIQFDPNSIFEVTWEEIYNWIESGAARLIAEVNNKLLSDIIDCFRSSDDITKYQKMLLDNSN